MTLQKEKTKQNIPLPQAFFLTVPLYQPFDINEDFYNQVSNLEFFHETLDAFCLGCKMQSVFKRNLPTDKKTPPNINARPLAKAMLPRPERNFTVELKCTRREEHRMIFHFLISNAQILKIGQFPSLADLTKHEIEKYRKILGNESYADFSRAVGLRAHGIGIGSFVYLRRIFGGLIEEAHKIARQGADWDELAFENNRMGERIEQLKASLPQILVNRIVT